MKFLFAPAAFLIFSIFSSPFIGAAEATSTRLWRQVLSSRVSRLRSRAGGDFDAASTFKRVQNTCPQPDVNDAGQQMTDMANAASAAMDDLANDRPNDKAQKMYNSVFGFQTNEGLRRLYYGIVKGILEALLFVEIHAYMCYAGTFDSIAAFANSGSDWTLYCDESWATYHPFKKTEVGADGTTKIG